MLERFYRLNTVAGVALRIENDGRLVIDCCLLSVKNSQVVIEKKLPQLHTINDLKDRLPEGIVVALNLSGKGILTKEITVNNHNGSIISRVLPNAKEDDFFTQSFTSTEAQFVSVIRRELANQYNAQFAAAGLNVLMMSLGPFPVSNIQSLLNFSGNQLVFAGNIVSLAQNNQWTKVDFSTGCQTDFPLKLGNEVIEERLVVPYAAAFQLLFSYQIDAVKANISNVDSVLAKHLKSRQTLTKAGVALAALFVLLLLNFIFFNWLNGQNQRLSGQAAAGAAVAGNLTKLKQNINRNEALLDSLRWDGGVNKATLIDQVAAVRPKGVIWSSVSITDNREIKVQGTADRITDLNEWSARVKTYKWVKAADLKGFTYDASELTGKFTLIVTY